MQKEDYMRLALSLARKGEGKVSPNPMVGAVLIKNGKIVGKGYHRYFGGPHAEVEAIEDAGKKAKGSSLFVTLEPCCHFGKTPPCTDAIIKSGIKEVFVATIDPNPLNEGKGIRVLKKAGIKVEVGICEKEARELNRWFFKFIKENIPYVIVKSAASLDGKIATFRGDSKWITSEKARRWGKNLRFYADAILVGINTVIKDDPQLLPPKKKERFFRLILDTHLNIPLKAKVLENQDISPTLVFTGKK
ncbi:bifunctional diaminohydroxyphosphoribosylaminopyrimidine deaminase/5-amino-6-(5-phosphoribosylamino)uracil reductase RibD, partial [Candidatus Aerophobetes bacterium]|nr:bifunctional diaminohydroxyphosphoribosylaminopyrimidine deaminase/5-amino-6-(5-phosphoribosylamino)uracil reductase RibD [Candidatus Aerophobetes bacterium]